MKTTKVIVKKPFEPFKIQTIPAKLEALYEIIECDCVDFINLGGGFLMAVDDEGKLVPKPANLIPRNPHWQDIIFGTVVITKDELETLTDEELEMLMATLPIHFHSVTPEENENIDPDDYLIFEAVFFDNIE